MGMSSRLNVFVDENPWTPCRFGDLVAAIRQHPHSLMGLEREIDDADLRRLKYLCELHFDSYRPLYEPLKAFLARSPPKYRAQLTSLLQPSESLIYDFASVSGNPQQRLIVTAAYEACLGRFFDEHESSISRTLLRQIQEDDDHKLFPAYFHKVESPRPLLSLKCLPGDIDSFWEEMLQRASPGRESWFIDLMA